MRMAMIGGTAVMQPYQISFDLATPRTWCHSPCSHEFGSCGSIPRCGSIPPTHRSNSKSKGERSQEIKNLDRVLRGEECADQGAEEGDGERVRDDEGSGEAEERQRRVAYCSHI